MKIAISGTYSSGKTFTAMALGHYTGIPRLLSKAIREIMPGLMPGKRLAEVSPEEFLHLMLARHIGRVKQECCHSGGYVSDGSSLQELLYGEARLVHGINPSQGLEDNARHDHDMPFFGRVLAEIGRSLKSHVAETYDIFFHLKHELPLMADGHRPMNADFRDLVDRRLLEVLDEIKVPYLVIGGSVEQRIQQISERLRIEPRMSTSEAVGLAALDYKSQDLRLEEERASQAKYKSVADV